MIASRVDVSELRRDLDAVLARVAHGERLMVCDGDRELAELGPPAGRRTLDRLIAEGKVAPPSRPARDFRPVKLPEEGISLSEALQEIRGER